MRRLLFVVVAGLGLAALAQSALAYTGTGTAYPLSVVDNGTGQQTDPHISGQYVVYTDQQGGGTAAIEYFDFLSSATVPTASGASDILADVSGGTVVFTRVFSGSSAIYAYPIGGTPVEVAPVASPLRRNPAIGGSTIAWEDTGVSTSSNPELVVFSDGSMTQLTNDPPADRNPSVSPDGSTVVWEKCAGPGSCDIYGATESGGSWTVTALAQSADNEVFPDTNGDSVVYSRLAGGSPQVYVGSVSGGGAQAIPAPPGLVGATHPRIAGDFVVFEGSDGLQSDVWVYDLVNNALHRITDTAENESLADVGVVVGSGALTVSVVWQTNEGGDTNAYATRFNFPFDNVPPLLSVPGTITVPATAPDGAVVTYTATATDNEDPSPVVTCSPPSGSMFPIGTRTVTCKSSDASGNVSQASFLVTVKGAADQINDLVALVDSYGLPGKLRKRLDAKLREAARLLAQGETNGACDKLTEFLKEVARETGSSLTKEQAEELSTEAEQIKAVIGCP
jgi:Tol biopolymer transport system component